MHKAFLSIVLTLSAIISNSQVKVPVAVKEYEQGLNPVDEILLFDLKEIKARKIDTAYIIYHPASWAEEPNFKPCICSYNDTLELYRFDSEGRIIQYTGFRQLGDYSTTHHYDTLGLITALTEYSRVGSKKGSITRQMPEPDSTTFKQSFIRQKVGNDSLITTITFLKFKHGLDTSGMEIKRFNPNGKLLEVKSTINKRNARELDDDTGESTYHFKYDYDNEGRLVYYRDFESNEYHRISYPFYGKLTEVYNATNDLLKRREVKLIDQDADGLTSITFGRKQITLTPLEKGSKLIKLITVVEPMDIPLMYYKEIVYK